jgi:Skp family chaperone for outer membrane proteins
VAPKPEGTANPVGGGKSEKELQEERERLERERKEKKEREDRERSEREAEQKLLDELAASLTKVCSTK